MDTDEELDEIERRLELRRVCVDLNKFDAQARDEFIGAIAPVVAETKAYANGLEKLLDDLRAGQCTEFPTEPSQATVNAALDALRALVGPDRLRKWWQGSMRE